LSTNFPPLCYLIGAEKSGTTTLAYLLNQHADIGVSNPKEPNYYSFEWDRGRDWYHTCFDESSENVLLDASTSYTLAEVCEDADRVADDTIPKRIKALRPDARFIYILRDPVQRTISAYHHYVRSGREKRDFKLAISSDPDYLNASRYRSQIEAYLNHFDITSFCFIDFRRLVEAPAEVAVMCAQFLGLDVTNYSPVLHQPKNQSFSYTWLGAMLRTIAGGATGLAALNNRIKMLTPRCTHDYLKKIICKETPMIDEYDINWLERQFYDEDYEVILNITGIDLHGDNK
jgi:hypothetical protein